MECSTCTNSRVCRMRWRRATSKVGIACRQHLEKRAGMNCCAKRFCARCFSKGFSTLALQRSNRCSNRSNCTCLTGLDFTVRILPCAATCWTPCGGVWKARKRARFSKLGSHPSCRETTNGGSEGVAIIHGRRAPGLRRKASMARHTRILLGLLLGSVASSPMGARAEWHHLSEVTHVEILPDGVELQARPAAVRVTAVSNSVIRVRLAPDGKFPRDFSWAVLPSNGVLPRVTVQQSTQHVEFATSGIKVRIAKSPLRIAFLDLADHVLSQDAPDRGMAWDGSEVRVWKTMPPDEFYFGLGDKAGTFNRRNQAFTMWNTDAVGWRESTDPLYKSIPFFLALLHGVAYGIFFDNTYRSSFDFGKESASLYSFGAEAGELNYYFLSGPHPKDVVKEFTALTGRMPMPPLWSLGYQQSRWSYYPEARVRELARNFRERRIPADVIYLDIDYQDGNRPFTVDRQRFPNFEGMIRDLSVEGFHTVAITDLHIKKEPGYP